MTRASLIRFVVGAAVAAVLLHLLVAVAAATALDRGFRHRIFNVRDWSDRDDERVRLVGAFLAERSRAGAPLIAFAGSSVTYGYPWVSQFGFSQLFAERHPTAVVVNASVMALDVSGIDDWIVCAAKRNRIRFSTLIVEIPVVNTTAHLVRVHLRHSAPEAVSSCEGASDPGYFQLALTRPRGIGWLGFLYDTAARQTTEEQSKITAVPDDHFASGSSFQSIRDIYVERIGKTLSSAGDVADAVYAFPSPVFIGGLRDIGGDADAVERQLRTAMEACAMQAGVHCIDLSSLWNTREYYYNLTHLSQAGHRAAASLIDAAVAGAARGTGW